MNEMEFTTANLELQETIIERGLESFIEIGRALAKIRDDRLYRQEYASFEVYCQTRWNLTRKRAYDLMSAATIRDGMEAVIEMSVSPIGDRSALPANEGQARELNGLEPAEAVDVMSTVSESTEGRPTAKAIREEVERRQGPERPRATAMPQSELDALNNTAAPEPETEDDPEPPEWEHVAQLPDAAVQQMKQDHQPIRVPDEDETEKDRLVELMSHLRKATKEIEAAVTVARRVEVWDQGQISSELRGLLNELDNTLTTGGLDGELARLIEGKQS